LHAAGLEVILDVVFNHTAESDEAGPTSRFAASTTELLPPAARPSQPATRISAGCGNTLNLAHPRVLQMVMDALRYWVERHARRRFPLRSRRRTDARQRVSAALRQDPLLQRVKLIAEPWDIGPDGYHLGAFCRAGANGTIASATTCAPSG
jgi:isoamylase